MILILEIYLTRKAWKRGWGHWALAPIVIGVGMGFMLGAMIGLAGGDPTTAMGYGFLIDIAIVITLGIMASRDREASLPSVPGEVHEELDQSYSHS